MSERARPRIHLTADGWVNDPLGLTWHDGAYHLFFQHVPGATEWAPACRWGHAVSPDLARWAMLPVALEPGGGEDGAWSGCLVQDDDGAATILYTAVHLADVDHGEVRLAHPVDDSWREWRKGEVVLRPPEAGSTAIFRDPFVLRDGDRWRTLVGGATAGGGAAFAYSSDDLTTWRADGVAAERSSALHEPVWTGVGWECPQLLDVDGHAVLIVSAWEPTALHHVVAAVGARDGARFTAESWQRLTVGDGYYAASAFHDREGRPGVVLWIRGVGSPAEGWAGAISVPHLLTVEDGRVVARPHPDAAAGCAVVTADGGVVATDGPTLVQVRPDAATDLRLQEPPYSALRVHASGDDLVVSADGRERLRLPRADAPLTVLVDGPVVELQHGAVIAACGR